MRIWSRRNVLKATLAGVGSVAWPWGGAFAQARVTELLHAPKHALVIGNGKYKHSPLKNPTNDARGMAASLKEMGFSVDLGLELTQSAFGDAIQAYSENLAKNKAVGLFYFAGHGAQLAWSNYLLPVDAEIEDVNQLRERAVALNSLIEGIRKAGNPMNVIILDACRDNPFGGVTRVERAGLSQLDAPPGTLLAYATAPGNTAIDGDGGDHGLYTEHLLREIKVPEARIEDVFKRARLGVRLRSKGMQIPWESTSLEEDFWFIPPQAVRKVAAAEIENEFKQELAHWSKIQSATLPEPFEDYLRRYPSGRYTELAQLRLDQALSKLGEKKVEVVSVPENPYTKGTAKANTAYKIGDSYSYREIDTLTGLQNKIRTSTVTQITDNEIVYDDGQVSDLLGNVLKSPGEFTRSPNQIIPAEFVVGKRWNTRFNHINSRGSSSGVDLNMRIADRERVTVPAGAFNAFRVEADGWGVESGAQWAIKRWYDPERVRHPVATEALIRARSGAIVRSTRIELISFKQA